MLGSRGRGRCQDVSEVEKGKDFRSTQTALWASFGGVTVAAPWSTPAPGVSHKYYVPRHSAVQTRRHYSSGGWIGTPTASNARTLVHASPLLPLSIWSQVK